MANKPMNIADVLSSVANSIREADMKDGMTIEEMVLALGKPRDWIQDHLKLLAAAGQLVVGRKLQMNLEGDMVPTIAYTIKTAKAKK
jgi:hypothetical protein